MRTFLIFDNVDADIPVTVNIPINSPNETNPQDLRFLIQATYSGGEGGYPRLIIEESIEGTVWTALEDTETWNPYTDIIDVLAIKDNYFMGKYLRARLEPNDVAGGTVWAIIGYKTKP